MTVRDSMKAALRPALLAGPILGLVGFLLLMAIAIALGEPDDELAMVIGIGSIGALVLGLIVIAPICFVGTTAMLSASSRAHAWCGLMRWIVAGAIVGPALLLVVWWPLAVGPDDDAATAIFVGVCGIVMGAIGGWLCRRLSARHIAELSDVDPEIFA